jgi:hypothetical protein
MATRDAYPGDATVGSVLTAAQVQSLPGGWLGYAEVTSNQGSITSGVDLTGLTVSPTADSSRCLKITAKVQIESTASGDQAELRILEDGSIVQYGRMLMSSSGNAVTITIVSVRTPAAGSHTYKLQAARSSGSGTLTMDASATTPCMILVEDIGPAS